MKTLRRLFSIAAAGALTIFAVSCAKDVTSEDTPEVIPEVAPDTFTYTIEAVTDGGTDTKTTLGSETSREVFWTQGDKVGVYQGSTEYVFTADKDKVKRTSLSYSGDNKVDDSKPVYAIYPSDGTSFDGKSSFTATVAAEQTCTASGTFSDGVNVAVAYAASPKSDLKFCNAVSYLKVGFKNLPSDVQVTKITVTSNNEKSPLAGTLKITPKTYPTAPEITVTNGSSSVSLSAANGYTLENDKYYYIAIAPGATFSTDGYSVSFTTKDGTFTKSQTLGKAVTVARNQISLVGKKNLNKFSVDGYWRVTDTYPERANATDLPEGDYLLVKKGKFGGTSDVYRVFDGSSTEPRMYFYNFNKSGKWAWAMPYGTAHWAIFGGGFAGATNHDGQWTTWVLGSNATDIIGKFFLYPFRKAYSDDGLQSYSDELIQNSSDSYAIHITDSTSKDKGMVFTFQLCKRPGGYIVGFDDVSKKAILNLQLTGCSLVHDETSNNDSEYSYWIDGTFTQESIDNLGYLFYVGKGAPSKDGQSPSGFVNLHPINTFNSTASKAISKTTRFGFCEKAVTTASYDSLNDRYLLVSAKTADGNGLKYTTETIQNCFMFHNDILCDEATPTSIWLYKKGTKELSYSEYVSMFLSK